MDQEFHGAPGFGYIVYWRRYKPSSVYDALWRKVRLGILLHVLHDIYDKLYIFLTISNIASSNHIWEFKEGGIFLDLLLLYSTKKKCIVWP